MHRTLPWLVLSCVSIAVAVPLAGLERVYADGDNLPRVEFNRQIRPLLSDRCFRCHGPDANHREADLRLDTADGAQADLGGRQAIVAGNPDESELYARIASTDGAERMPPAAAGKPLTAAEIALVRRWISEGAEYQPHWSFIPPKRAPVPPVKNTDWPRGAIDQFILAKLESADIPPASDADRVTLIRRLSFDLLGLPPRPTDVAAFLQDTGRDAYEKIVEAMLASEHFGERMAMFWLDLVRYADTVGYHGDQEHSITPYRDYVIKAFNDNLPFDRFTIEQIAGDLLPDATIDQRIASGYNRLLQTSHEGGVQIQEYLHKYDADRIRNLGSVWMGATLGCVECHDHKYDPYTQRDYYGLVAVFSDVDDLRTFKGTDGNPVKREPELVVLSPIDRERLKRLDSKIQQLEGQLATGVGAGAALGDEATRSLRTEIADAQRERDALSGQTRRTMVTEAISPKTVRVLARGDWMDSSGEVVDPAFPAFLKESPAVNGRLTRLDLARWLTAADHPQTSRVFVNRLWALYFGNGLSNSLEDSGSQGEWPSHPQLLDWLATEFSGSGWNIKHMVRLIVTSRAYRQSSQPRPELADRDPHNRLLARQAIYRLPAEIVRDNALSVSGLLVDQVGGASARPYQPAGYYKYLNFPKREYQADGDANQYRRGVYVHWQRTYLHPMLKAFDAPSREECTARRPVSNTPLAALTLLNDPSFVEMARVFAVRMIREGSLDDGQRLHWAWKEALSREPTADEIASLKTLLDESRASFRQTPESAEKLLSVGLSPRPEEIDAVELAAWTAIARALFNLHESITRY
jgi:hypothetical protein